MKKSNLNSGPDETILEGTRMILVNKKNIYTVSVESESRVTFHPMLDAPVDIQGPRQNVSVWPK